MKRGDAEGAEMRLPLRPQRLSVSKIEVGCDSHPFVPGKIPTHGLDGANYPFTHKLSDRI